MIVVVSDHTLFWLALYSTNDYMQSSSLIMTLLIDFYACMGKGILMIFIRNLTGNDRAPWWERMYGVVWGSKALLDLL